jgi:GGDEF domain-containing protein
MAADLQSRAAVHARSCAVDVPMPERLHFSPSAWALLEMLQRQAGVSLGVVHVWLDPVQQSTAGEITRALEQPGVADEVLKAIKTGEVRVEAARGMTIGIFPLRRMREIVGCLIVSRRSADRTCPADTPADVRAVQGTGAIARTALEADLFLNTQVSHAQSVTRRLHGILRFLGQLGAYGSEREIMHAVLQAATVWFDLDCRIYQRQADGSYMLAGALPTSEQAGVGTRLEGARAQQLLAAGRFASACDLDDLGLTGRRDEVLLLPVGIRQPEWIILLAGALDGNAELTFSAIARVLAGELQGRELARIERWQEQLSTRPTDVLSTPDRFAATVLELLVADVAAEGARLTLVVDGSERIIAVAGSMPADSAEPKPGSLAVTFQLTANAGSKLELWSAMPLAPSASGIVQTWIKAFRPRFAEALPVMTGSLPSPDVYNDASAFERRIQEEVERAKRFNLGLGLVLIGPPSLPLDQSSTVVATLVDAVRSELRASDLLGRVRGDRVAVLLVHSGSEGAESVATRLRQRLTALPWEETFTSVLMGKAMFSAECATAEALIAKALRQAQDLSLRN